LEEKSSNSAVKEGLQWPNSTNIAASTPLIDDPNPTPTPTYYPGISNDELAELLEDDYPPAEAPNPLELLLERPVAAREDGKGNGDPRPTTLSAANAVQQDAAVKTEPTAEGKTGGAGAEGREALPLRAGAATQEQVGGAVGSGRTPAAQRTDTPQTLIAPIEGEAASITEVVGGMSGHPPGATAGETSGEGEKGGTSDTGPKEATDTGMTMRPGSDGSGMEAQGDPELAAESTRPPPAEAAGPEAEDAKSTALASRLKSRWVSLEEASHHEGGPGDDVRGRVQGALDDVPQAMLEEHPVFISEQTTFGGSDDDYQDDGEDDLLEEEEEEELPKYVDLEKGRHQSVWERKVRRLLVMHVFLCSYTLKQTTLYECGGAWSR
jgi:hypothetical protein